MGPQEPSDTGPERRGGRETDCKWHHFTLVSLWLPLRVYWYAYSSVRFYVEKSTYTHGSCKKNKQAPGSHRLFSGEFHRKISFNPWITKTWRVTKTVNLRTRASLFSFHYCEMIRHRWCKRAMLGELKKKPRKQAEQMWNVVICPETASSKINVGTDELRDRVGSCGLWPAVWPLEWI